MLHASPLRGRPAGDHSRRECGGAVESQAIWFEIAPMITRTLDFQPLSRSSRTRNRGRRAKILRTFLARNQSLLDRGLRQFADCPARGPESFGQTARADRLLAVQFVEHDSLGNSHVFVRRPSGDGAASIPPYKARLNHTARNHGGGEMVDLRVRSSRFLVIQLEEN